MMNSLNRKRQIAQRVYEEMVTIQLNMIDEAVEKSNMETAIDIINDIKEKSKNDKNAGR